MAPEPGMSSDPALPTGTDLWAPANSGSSKSGSVLAIPYPRAAHHGAAPGLLWGCSRDAPFACGWGRAGAQAVMGPGLFAQCVVTLSAANAAGSILGTGEIPAVRPQALPSRLGLLLPGKDSGTSTELASSSLLSFSPVLGEGHLRGEAFRQSRGPLGCSLQRHHGQPWLQPRALSAP